MAEPLARIGMTEPLAHIGMAESLAHIQDLLARESLSHRLNPTQIEHISTLLSPPLV